MKRLNKRRSIRVMYEKESTWIIDPRPTRQWKHRDDVSEKEPTSGSLYHGLNYGLLERILWDH